MYDTHIENLSGTKDGANGYGTASKLIYVSMPIRHKQDNNLENAYYFINYDLFFAVRKVKNIRVLTTKAIKTNKL